jgi:hypothetical protein
LFLGNKKAEKNPPDQKKTRLFTSSRLDALKYERFPKPG